MNGAIIDIVGNLTADPKMIKGKNDKEFCSFSVAVSTSTSDGNGGYVTNYYSCSAASTYTADAIMRRCQKGTSVRVNGNLTLVDYTKKDGTTAKSLNVNAYQVDPLARTKDAPQASTSAQEKPRQQHTNVTNYDKPAEDDANDMPF